MTAIAKVSNTIPAISPDLNILRAVAAFCGIGLFVSLLVASYGLDLSAGFSNSSKVDLKSFCGFCACRANI